MKRKPSPGLAKSKHPQSIRIFQSPWLEMLTHVHPLTPLLLWMPVVVVLLWKSFGVGRVASFQHATLGLSGLLCWSLLEYILHRFLFHFRAHSPIEKRIQFIIHGLHHADPSDATRLVMPPTVSIVLALLFYGIFRWLLGEILVRPFFAAFLVGYLAYDYIHFSVHHFTPHTRFGMSLKRNHMRHHFDPKGSRWGVSSPFWDHVFGSGN